MTLTVDSIVPQTPNTPNVDAADNTDRTEGTAKAQSVEQTVNIDEAPHEEGPRRAIAEQHHENAARVESLLKRAGVRMPVLNSTLASTLAKEIPRPGLFRTGHRLYAQVRDAAQACDRAAAELGHIPAREFTRSPIDEAAFTALKHFTDAQQSFAAELGRFAEKTGSTKDHIQTLIQSANNRAAEAINLVATLQLRNLAVENRTTADTQTLEKIQRWNLHINEEVSLKDNLLEIGTHMHGAHFDETLRNGITELSTRLNALEENQTKLGLKNFQEKAQELKNLVEAYRSTINAVGDRESLLRDQDLQQSLISVLDKIAKRLEDICNHRVKDFDKDITRLMSKIDSHSLDELRIYFPEEVGPIFDILPDIISRYNAAIDTVIQNLDSYSGVKIKKSLCRALRDLLSGNKNIAALELARTAMIAANERCPDEEIQQRLEGVINKVTPYGEQPYPVTKKFVQSFRNGAFKLAYDDFNTYNVLNKLSNSSIYLSPEVVKQEISEITTLYDNIRSDDAFLPQNALSTAFEHNVDMNTLLGAYSRGISADQLELQAGDKVLDSATPLGQGAVNEVYLCTFLTEDGNERQLVFKPETNARHGLEHLVASNIGYANDARVMQINVATTRAADAIGCGNTIARSSIGSHDGQMGLFMERASGVSASELCDDEKMKTIVRQAKKAGTLNTLCGNLMRELCRLEWADALAGQVDRHRDNYLLDIDPKTGSVKVTGIDNDASFGERRIGMTKYDMTGFDKPKALKETGQVVDISLLTGPQTIAMCRCFGLNQASKPSRIDEATYARLMSIDKAQYRAALQPCLSQKALHAALLRLEDAQNYARELQAHNCVISDWESPELLEQVREEQVKFDGLPRTDRPRAEFVSNGFFARDFLSFFTRTR